MTTDRRRLSPATASPSPNDATTARGPTPSAPFTSRYERVTVDTPSGPQETVRVTRVFDTPGGPVEVTPRADQLTLQETSRADAIANTPLDDALTAPGGGDFFGGAAPVSAIPAALGGGSVGFATGNNCEGCAGAAGGVGPGTGFGPTQGISGFAGGAVSPVTPPGTPLSPEQEAALWSQLETREAQRRAAAGLPREFSENERRAILGILASEGGNSGGNLATMLNRSYSSRAPLNEIVFADRQFTPATSLIQGYRDRMAGIDDAGFNRFSGGYYNPATTNLEAALGNYEGLLNQGVNYFHARQLNGGRGQFGTVVLDSGNLYQAGPAGNFSNRGAELEQRFLSETANLRASLR